MRAIIALIIILTITTTIKAQTCQMWCDSIFNTTFIEKCGTNSDFADVAACMTYCAAVNMTAGTTTNASATGNTIGCRIYHAGVAAGDVAGNIHCKHATQTGGGVCGSYCEVYCDIVQKGPCKGMFSSTSDCMTACGLFPTTGVDINLTAPANWHDDVQCRIYHAGSPANADSALHCPHAYVTGGKVCVSNADHCTGYCRMFVSSCGTTRAPPAYANVANCVKLCQGYAMLAPASFNNQTGYRATDYTVATISDSVDCRTYHSIAAIADPTTHCAHGSIDGGNVCGNECGVYCNLRNLANSSCAGMITVDGSTCLASCNALNKSGNYLTSANGDNTLQCRLYHWAAEIALNLTVHCAHGNINGSTTCVAMTTSTSGGSTGSATSTTGGSASTTGSATSTTGGSLSTTTGVGAVSAAFALIVLCLAVFL